MRHTDRGGETLILTLARPAMGTRFEFVLVGDDPVFLRAAGEEALDEVERLEAQLSRFRPDSEISGINARAAHEPVVVEPRLFALLERVACLWAATDGAFDPTVGALMRGYEERTVSPPTSLEAQRTQRGREASLDAASLGAVSASSAPLASEASGRCVSDCLPIGWQHVLLDSTSRTIRFEHPGISLDLGAIGKGYAIDQAASLLREAGVEAALLHAGTSSVVALGAPPEDDAWSVAIRHPRHPDRYLARVSLRDRSLSVSAPHGKTLTVGDRQLGHVLDPRTGSPVDTALLAAIVADSATDGDALSTALLALGPAGLPLVERYDPDSGGLLATTPSPDRSDEMEVSLLGAANWELCPPLPVVTAPPEREM